MNGRSEQTAWTAFLLAMGGLSSDEQRLARIAYHDAWRARGGPEYAYAAAGVLVAVLALVGWIAWVVA